MDGLQQPAHTTWAVFDSQPPSQLLTPKTWQQLVVAFAATPAAFAVAAAALPTAVAAAVAAASLVGAVVELQLGQQVQTNQ